MKRRLRWSGNWFSGWHHCYGAYVGLRRLKLSYLHSTLKSFARASILGSKKQHDFQYSEQDLRLSKAKETWTMLTTTDLLRIATPHSIIAVRQSTLREFWRTASSVLRTSTMVHSIGLVAMNRGSGVNSFKRFSAFGLRGFAEHALTRDVYGYFPIVVENDSTPLASVGYERLPPSHSRLLTAAAQRGRS